MDLSMNWLKQYVDLDCDINTFVEKITLSGSKVESVKNAANEISNVVVGKVLSIKKHPDADKLVITQLDIGKESPIQVVTAATNLYEGAYVPVALDGAVLKGGIKIKKGKLRGEISQGMMCSVEEFGFTRNDYPEAPENGIYIFEKEQPLGADVLYILEIDDNVVEFEITSNRPDCFSILGLSRETAATFRKPLKYPNIVVKEEAKGNINEMIDVEIKNHELCPRYIARVVKNIKIEPSPQWLRHKLTACGVRPINNIVDITNYVMLEFGQPMHAFDIDTIDEKKIIVRNAAEGEKFTTLDGNDRILDSSMLVISDCNKAVAVAGVMGGENSKVSENAHTILFESANFNGTSIRLTSKKLGLRTDASSRYEKGLDPNLALEAVNRAVQLVEELNCGEVVKGIVDAYPNKKQKWSVEYSSEKINKILGTDISDSEMIDLFKLIEVEADGKKAIIPTFRPDLETQADLAEEIGRFYGYDKIKTTLASGTPTVGKKNKKQIVEDIIKNTMVSLGLCEGMCFSFESPKVFDKLNIDKDSDLRNTIKISNPLGEDFSIMRTTTLNGILYSLSTNYNRRNEEASLFEIGKVYIPKSLPFKDYPDEITTLTIGMYGKCNFYDIKGVIEELSEVIGLKNKLDYSPISNLSFMHPGRCAEISLNGDNIGFVGEAHPKVCQNYEIEAKVYIAVLDVFKLCDNTSFERIYNPLPKFPAIQRDIAMIVSDDIIVRDIENIIFEKGGKFLENVQLFDVYKGKQIKEGYKSVAYNISFRAQECTLTDEEVNSSMNKILKSLEEKLKAQLREK